MPVSEAHARSRCPAPIRPAPSARCRAPGSSKSSGRGIRRSMSATVGSLTSRSGPSSQCGVLRRSGSRRRACPPAAATSSMASSPTTAHSNGTDSRPSTRSRRRSRTQARAVVGDLGDDAAARHQHLADAGEQTHGVAADAEVAVGQQGVRPASLAGDRREDVAAQRQRAADRGSGARPPSRRRCPSRRRAGPPARRRAVPDRSRCRSSRRRTGR